MTPQTIAGMLLQQRDNPAPALFFEDQTWSWQEYVGACAAVANLLLARRQPGPFHVGVLLDNVPDFPIICGGAALAGAAIVGVNPTRRGAELERDFRHSDCQFVITEDAHLADIDGVALPVDDDRFFNVDQPAWRSALAEQAGKPIPVIDINPADPLLLIFTSGTTGDPKAALCSQARLAMIGFHTVEMNALTAEDRCYLAMPLFHSNSIMANWAPAIFAGAAVVLRRKFSASGFLRDIRRYGCTYMNYVGKPLTYILATPEQPDDADNTLRLAFGNEAVVHDIKRFQKRFACEVRDNYGSTEGGIAITRTAETPATALGVAPAGTVILDPETGRECAIAEFDQHGRLINADEAVGEIANRETAIRFEGYWRNQEANEERTRDGIFWSGDLGYRDAAGFFYFGGRSYDWLRVDGENFAAAPLESIMTRVPGISLAAVYAVPNWDVGDDVMVAVTLGPGAAFDAGVFHESLKSQPDMGSKSMPRYVRVIDAMPMTASNKVVKRDLRAQRWMCDDPVWFRDQGKDYVLLDDDRRQAIERRFTERGRGDVLHSGV